MIAIVITAASTSMESHSFDGRRGSAALLGGGAFRGIGDGDSIHVMIKNLRPASTRDAAGVSKGEFMRLVPRARSNGTAIWHHQHSRGARQRFHVQATRFLSLSMLVSPVSLRYDTAERALVRTGG